MNKLILVVWLLASRDNVVMQYAVKYNSEAACQTEAAKHQDERKAVLRAYPVKYAECVMEVK